MAQMALIALTVMSTIAEGNIAAAEGKAQQQALNYQAQQKEIQAGQERAASQRTAAGKRKEAALMGSRGLAVSAASGAGALDPTVVNLLGDIEAEGEYQALMDMYGGEQSARNLESGAELSRYEGRMAKAAGKAKQKAAFLKAGAQGLYGGSKAGMFDKKTAPTTIMDDRNYSTMYSTYG